MPIDSTLLSTTVSFFFSFVGNASEIREPLGTLGMPVHEMDIDGNMLAVG